MPILYDGSVYAGEGGGRATHAAVSVLCGEEGTSLELQVCKVGLLPPSGVPVSGGCCTFIRGETCQEPG